MNSETYKRTSKMVEFFDEKDEKFFMYEIENAKDIQAHMLTKSLKLFKKTNAFKFAVEGDCFVLRTYDYYYNYLGKCKFKIEVCEDAKI